MFNSILSNLNFSLNLPVFSFSNEATKADKNNVQFKSDSLNTKREDIYTQLDSSSNFRNNLFCNPIISYDYKNGHYLGI
jgi:hypothetical protein